MHVRNYYILWGIIALIYCCNLTIDVMEVDAAQYAAMSAEMQDNGSYLQVYHRGQDYLDKPPLLFWLSSASFSLFGVSNAAYKLPALLALLLGLWATYRFALLYDKRETALIAVTILASTQAFFLMTNDVRTDGLLTGFVMFAVYHCAAYLKHRRWYSLVFAGIGVGLAMLAKGPIGAIIPAAAVFADRVFKGAWKDFFDPRWVILITVALVLLLPMCYGLYMQFDLHPEKNVYGLEGPSGLRFFFWTQSFGRITGEIYWDNNAPWYYFLMTFLWDFMPWVIVFASAFVFTLTSMRRNLKGGVEYYTAGGFVLILILLSLSRYKLPHYIFPLFPFAAIMTARYLGKMQQKDVESPDRKRRPGVALAWTQLVLMHAFYAIIVFGFLKAFPPSGPILPVITVIGYGIMWIAFLKYPSSAHRIIMTGTITAVVFNLFLSQHFYPHLTQYQSGAQAGRVIKADKLVNERAYFSCPQPSYTLDFYSGKFVPDRKLEDLGTLPSGSWVFLLETDISSILNTYPEQFHIVQEFEHYKVSMLKLKFVLAETRQRQLKKSYLIEKL